jgi:hypothetical protein
MSRASKETKTAYSRKCGHRPRSELVDGACGVGVRAEGAAREWWNRHFPKDPIVSQTETRGPDLISLSGAKIEVKSAVKIQHANSWVIGGVRPLRQSDNFIVIVWPDSRCAIRTMEMHLKRTSKCGNATVTKLRDYSHV